MKAFFNRTIIGLLAILLIFSFFESPISSAATSITADQCAKLVNGECEDQEYISDEELEKMDATDIDVYDKDPEPKVDVLTRANFSSEEEYKQWLRDNPQVSKQARAFITPLFRALVKKLSDGRAVQQTLKADKKYIKTINGKLANKVHPVTGVKFGDRGFPQFYAKATVRIALDDIKKSSTTHFRKANQILLIQIKSDSGIRARFTSQEIKQIENSKTPTGYTWHHHEDRGILQLVDRQTHANTAHTGGRAIWGTN
ncbi:HNH endonuclease [Exiguobacterium sp. 22311]|uniref:HNH endonuclease n=1 Tax=Exiguobacterium sp. 22311 TaxID=3453907 RepID=UPI003F83B4D4